MLYELKLSEEEIKLILSVLLCVNNSDEQELLLISEIQTQTGFKLWFQFIQEVTKVKCDTIQLKIFVLIA